MPVHEPINMADEMQIHQDRLITLDDLIHNFEKLSAKDQEFADSLIMTFLQSHALSARQWDWVDKLNDRIIGTKPLYGDFRSVLVAFQIAGEHLKQPKIRLVSEEGRYVQLNFSPDTSTIKVFVDGWQGHGHRKFAGTLEEGMIKPYSADRMTDDVRACIENFALNPQQAAKAFADKMGVCCYCAQRLTDPTSKKFGYGATCAEHFNQPYGIDLKELFA